MGYPAWMGFRLQAGTRLDCVAAAPRRLDSWSRKTVALEGPADLRQPFLSLSHTKDTMVTTTTSSNRLVTGLFSDRASAESAYGAAHGYGYRPDDVNLVMSDETRKKHFTGTTAGKQTELGSKAAEGAGVGGAIGGTVGAIAAAIAAVGTSLVIPGLGLVVAGPLAAAIAGAGAGAAGGGLIGALVGWGMPEERVKEYEEGVKSGGILMGVQAKDDADAARLESDWKGYGARQVYR